MGSITMQCNILLLPPIGQCNSISICTIVYTCMYTQKKKNRKDNYMYMKMVKVNDCWSIKTKNVSEVKVRVND